MTQFCWLAKPRTCLFYWGCFLDKVSNCSRSGSKANRRNFVVGGAGLFQHLVIWDVCLLQGGRPCMGDSKVEVAREVSLPLQNSPIGPQQVSSMQISSESCCIDFTYSFPWYPFPHFLPVSKIRKSPLYPISEQASWESCWVESVSLDLFCRTVSEAEWKVASNQRLVQSFYHEREQRLRQLPVPPSPPRPPTGTSHPLLTNHGYIKDTSWLESIPTRAMIFLNNASSSVCLRCLENLHEWVEMQFPSVEPSQKLVFHK